ncbi:unnamed protein product [Acanthosepion pharaonis]|uniref:Uncharacterized protein n=1 Tax=Acanthosepion pharaonis TaxID=158019 RepID=A0A812DXS2_ACAPH|nr:unnamed protein product [Sepia pharaonis]
MLRITREINFFYANTCLESIFSFAFSPIVMRFSCGNVIGELLTSLLHNHSLVHRFLLSISLIYLCQSVHIYLSIYPSISISLPPVHISLSLYIYIYTYILLFISIYLSIYLSIYISIYLIMASSVSVMRGAVSVRGTTRMEQTQTTERHTDEEESVRDPDEEKFHIPDGGWGWVVCFAGFMVNFICHGLVSSHGIIALGLTEYFEDTLSKTTMAVSIFNGVGLCVGSYFKKKRTLAVGIASSGCGIGGFALNYLLEQSISFYGMRGTFLIISGLILNIVACGALCRPLKKMKETTLQSVQTETNLGLEPDGDTTKKEEGTNTNNSGDSVHPEHSSK